MAKKHIHLAYGKTGLDIEVDPAWDVTVIEPAWVPGLPDPASALRRALRDPIRSQPLAERVKPGGRVGIIFNDITRPTPRELILEAVLGELAAIPKENVTLFNALGTHRPNTETELRGMLGDRFYEDYRVVQNDSFDPVTQVCLGRTAGGNEVWINRELAACDLKILTGFIEPHLFAGFSGGGKAILPGMAGQRTVLENHNAAMIAHPGSTWGVIEGNPIQQEIRQAARLAGQTFLVNVTLNKHKEITGVFAGDMIAAHDAGCAFAKGSVMVPVSQPFDIVVTTNSGYPLDLNLYQSVKGMSAASGVVRAGGAMIVAAECWDGIPDHGLFAQLLRDAGSPRKLLEMVCQPGFLEQDQWQAQIQAQVQMNADVYLHSSYLRPEQVRAALLEPAPSLEETLAELVKKYGPAARIGIMPEGPQTVPYLSTQAFDNRPRA
jgi:nickel-dependent lactate racemase